MATDVLEITPGIEFPDFRLKSHVAIVKNVSDQFLVILKLGGNQQSNLVENCIQETES